MAQHPMSDSKRRTIKPGRESAMQRPVGPNPQPAIAQPDPKVIRDNFPNMSRVPRMKAKTKSA